MNDVSELTRKLVPCLIVRSIRAAAGEANREIARGRHHANSAEVLAQIYTDVLSAADGLP